MVGKVGGNPAAILKKMEGLAKSDDGQISAGEQEILNQLQGALGKLEGLGQDGKGTGQAGDADGMPPGVMDKFRGLAKADDGKIDGTEQQVLNQLQSAFDNIQSPRIKELISQVAQKMGLSGAQATARMASGQAAGGPQGSPAASAGGASDPLRCNSCGGGGQGGAAGARGASGGSALPALGGKGGMMFEDMLAQFLFDVIKEMQEELKKKMAEYKAMSKSGKGGGGKGGAGGADSDSRQLLFEEIKNLMQKMQQMIQSLSNILNTLHNGAMNSIRNIR